MMAPLEEGKKDSEIVFRCESSGFVSYAKKFKDGTTVNDGDFFIHMFQNVTVEEWIAQQVKKKVYYSSKLR